MKDHVATPEKILLNVAQPELYRLNSFRVTELPVDAEARDISRRQAVIKQAIEIGVPIPPGYGRVLPLKEQTGADQLSEAMQNLTDPGQRLIDEIFWFWPREMGKSREDPALTTLGSGEISQVYSNWLQLRDVPGDEGNALHNLAILSHVLALDWEHTALARDLQPEEQQERDTWWKRAFQSWRALLENEAFWSRVTARIRALDDPRLTTGMVQRIRMNLPQALLSINAHLATNAAERDDVAECQRQLDLLHDSGFDKQDVSDALHHAVEPLRERIKAQCKKIDPQIVLDNLGQASDKTLTFLDQTEPMLKMLNRLLPAGDATRDGLHDEVASRALQAAITYGNKTEDWRASMSIIKRVQPLAVGELLRERVEENYKIIDANIQAMLCWYCQTRFAQKGLHHDIPMYGNVRTYFVGYNQRRTEWQRLNVPVQCCRECWELHDRARTFKSIGGVLGGIVAALGIFPVSSIATAILPSWGPCPDFIAVALLFWLLISLGIRCGSSIILAPKKVRAERDVQSFPAVQFMMTLGWKIGTKP